jgi:hypothetical protein
MKDKIIFFLVGLLTGAVISTGSIFIYTLATKDDGSSSQQSSMEMRGNRPSDMGGDRMNGGTPPDMPESEQEQ